MCLYKELCNNNFYKYDGIITLIKYLNGDINFCFSYQYKEICKNCFNKSNIKNFIHSPYISIMANDLYKIDIEYEFSDVILNALKFSNINCNLYEIKYGFTNIYIERSISQIIYPLVLIIIFEFENTLGDDNGLKNTHYYLLNKLHNNININDHI